jgi:hypothetical protein
MQRLDEFEGQVDPAPNELESHIFQLQNGLTQELPEHLDAVKVRSLNTRSRSGTGFLVLRG